MSSRPSVSRRTFQESDGLPAARGALDLIGPLSVARRPRNGLDWLGSWATIPVGRSRGTRGLPPRR